MSATCDTCRFWDRGTVGTNQTGYCRSRRHRVEAARALEVAPAWLGPLITWFDNDCRFHQPIETTERESHVDNAGR